MASTLLMLRLLELNTLYPVFSIEATARLGLTELILVEAPHVPIVTKESICC